jgi:hypothetical protein
MVETETGTVAGDLLALLLDDIDEADAVAMMAMRRAGCRCREQRICIVVRGEDSLRCADCGRLFAFAPDGKRS